MCDTSASVSDMASYSRYHMDYMAGELKLPNVGQDQECWGGHIIANPGNVRWVIPVYTPPVDRPPESG